jgi:hypothetical protein
MRRTWPAVFLFLLLPLSSIRGQQEGGKPLLAVAPFDNHTRHDAAGIEAADLFIKCLFKTGRYRVVHPVEAIRKLMGHTRGCLGVDEREAAQRIGQSLGCNAILIGSVNTLVPHVPGGETPEGKPRMLVELSARLVDTGSAETLWRSHYTLAGMGTDPVFNRFDVAVAELAETLVHKYPGVPDKPSVEPVTE